MAQNRLPLDLRDLIDLVAEICDEKNLMVCFKETLKGTGMAAIGAAVCGLLMGPIGFGIGGALGGAAGTILTNGKFQPVGTVLKNMSEEKWQKLYARLKHAFRNFNAKDAATIITLIMSGTECKELAVLVVRNFLTTDLSGAVRIN